jgi:DNA-binding GntR family transcriptional regulator
MRSFDKVYRGILKALYEGRFLPGQRLVAPDLMREFEASRNTIREVLNRLSAVGVLSMIPNQSATVRLMSRGEIVELLEVVSALLCLATNSATRNISRDTNQMELSKAYREIEQSREDVDLGNFVEARENYYRTILKIGGNRELIRLFPTMHVHLMRLQLRSVPYVAEGALFDDFQDLNAAILADDPARATRAAQAHVQNMIDAVNALPDTMFNNETTARTRSATAQSAPKAA